MKVTIEMDMTPVEIRVFLGLPDMTLLNGGMVEEVLAHFRADADRMGPLAAEEGRDARAACFQD